MANDILRGLLLIYIFTIIVYPAIKAIIKYFLKPKFYTVEIRKIIHKTEMGTTWKIYTCKIPHKKKLIVTIED